MLRRIPHNRNQDKPNKSLADLRRLDNLIDAPDQIIRAHRNDDRGDDEHEGRGDGAHAGLLGLDVGAALGHGGVGALAVEEVVVGAQLEEEVEDVKEEEDYGGAAGEEEDGVAWVGLYALLLAVEDVVELGAALVTWCERGEMRGGEGRTVAGMTSEAEDSARSEHVVCAVPEGKCCSMPLPSAFLLFRSPPKKKHMPRTSSRFERIEPSIEACTTSIWLS